MRGIELKKKTHEDFCYTKRIRIENSIHNFFLNYLSPSYRMLISTKYDNIEKDFAMSKFLLLSKWILYISFKIIRKCFDKSAFLQNTFSLYFRDLSTYFCWLFYVLFHAVSSCRRNNKNYHIAMKLLVIVLDLLAVIWKCFYAVCKR